MARVKFPLMSLDASGNFGLGKMQVRSCPGYISIYRPPDPASQNKHLPSAAQLAQRNKVRSILIEWWALSPVERQGWAETASNIKMANGWAAFLSSHLQQGVVSVDTLLTDSGLPILDSSGQQIEVD